MNSDKKSYNTDILSRINIYAVLRQTFSVEIYKKFLRASYEQNYKFGCGDYTKLYAPFSRTTFSITTLSTITFSLTINKMRHSA